MESILLLLITIAIIFGIAWGCFWLIDRTGVPHPVNMIAKVVIAIIAIWALLERTGLLAGVGT